MTDDDDLLWVVSEWHHQMRHRSDPKRYFEDEESAEVFMEEQPGSYRLNAVRPGDDV